MKIRHASLSDLGNLVQAEAVCFPLEEAAGEGLLRARIRAYPNHFWLLYEGEHLLGYSDGPVTDLPEPSENLYKRAELHRENGIWQMIFALGIMPAYRNHGLASELLRHVIDTAKAQGRRGVVLICKETQADFFETFNFKKEKTYPGSDNAVWALMRLRF